MDTKTKGSGNKAAEEKTPATGQTKEKEQDQKVLPVEFTARVTSLNPNGAVRANVSLNINGCFAVYGIKVVEGSNGLFVSMPSYKTAGGEYREYCYAFTTEAREQLHKAVFDAYKQAVAMGQESLNKHTSMSAAPEGQPMEVPGM